MPAPNPLPAWLRALDEDDLLLLRRFLVASGSLKQLAEDYGVSYPTIRLRLNRLIAKVKVAEAPGASDPFDRTLRLLVADGRLRPAVARTLTRAHRDALTRSAKPRPS
jgi:hypothetical protein